MQIQPLIQVRCLSLFSRIAILISQITSILQILRLNQTDSLDLRPVLWHNRCDIESLQSNTAIIPRFLRGCRMD